MTSTSSRTRPSGCSERDEIDPRLFDVTALIEMGYDDAGTRTVPLIASYTRAKTRAAGATDGPAGQPDGPRSSRRSTAPRSPRPKPQARTFWTIDRAEGRRRPTRPRACAAGSPSCGWTAGSQVSLKDSVPQIGAPGRVGRRASTAPASRSRVLDTGVDVHHPDLVDQIDEHGELRPR